MMEQIGDLVHVESRFSLIADVLILTQDWSTVCTECTIGSEIILDTHTMELLGDLGHVESRLGLFADSANLDARLVHGCVERTIGLEIILDTPDGMPR
jgi:hypothetical protein